VGNIKVHIIEQEERWNLEPTYGDDLDEDWNNFQEATDED
jgi:hypothetical protein